MNAKEEREKKKKKMKEMNLRKERHGGFFIGDGASNGNELAFLNLFLENDLLLDCGEGPSRIAGGGHGGFVGLGDGKE